MFILKQAVHASRTMLGDIIPLTQICALADLVPRFGAQADPQLTKQTSLTYSNELWLNKYFDKETFFCSSPAVCMPMMHTVLLSMLSILILSSIHHCF